MSDAYRIQHDAGPRSMFVTVQDGLRLHVHEYGPRTASCLPVVCLPGLTRTVADFDALAPALANGPPSRRVIAIDSRGRGQSEYDKNPDNYNLSVELGDVVAVLTALEIGAAVFVGSSRGGMLTMLLAVAHPTAIAGAVLHDIGPVIEPKGVVRIKSYVGRLPQPRSYADGAEILHRLFGSQFPKLSEAQWLAAARRTWKIEDGARAHLRRAPRAHAGRGRYRAPAAAALAAIRGAQARAASGHSRRQLGYLVAGDRCRHARASSEHGGDRGPRPGSCPAVR